MSLVKGRTVAFLVIALAAAALLPATVLAAEPGKDSASGPDAAIRWTGVRIM
jgi:hypothetical protein